MYIKSAQTAPPLEQNSTRQPNESPNHTNQVISSVESFVFARQTDGISANGAVSLLRAFLVSFIPEIRGDKSCLTSERTNHP